jgi:hypothetical protein
MESNAGPEGRIAELERKIEPAGAGDRFFEGVL